ncbi:MAG: hypothetical protein CEN91_554 [Candidatus Berkelbacteria bacterium Licking1014_85]|uniref:Uncharacterized protein n=1 Tax=Candidatus Berkelbacteria bacterium Licking1014_85 TaxID=2017148 RepID=A0A554LH01_9BACT|nr:MAG: hypothetical protein CEN91_554 [Candidatus Berkelbacteria bacterium Licking1014_85]
MNFQFLDKFILIGNLNVQLNSAGQLVKLYRKCKRALEYANQSNDAKTQEVIRNIKEDVMILFGSRKNIDRLLQLGAITQTEYDEILKYLEK